MCRQLEISRTAYYKWLHHEMTYEEFENIRIAKLLKRMMNAWSDFRISANDILDQAF